MTGSQASPELGVKSDSNVECSVAGIVVSIAALQILWVLWMEGMPAHPQSCWKAEPRAPGPRMGRAREVKAIWVQ